MIDLNVIFYVLQKRDPFYGMKHMPYWRLRKLVTYKDVSLNRDPACRLFGNTLNLPLLIQKPQLIA
jgi:hypothetical protein